MRRITSRIVADWGWPLSHEEKQMLYASMLMALDWGLPAKLKKPDAVVLSEKEQTRTPQIIRVHSSTGRVMPNIFLQAKLG